MSLETIRDAIRKAGQEQVRRIESAAQAQVKEILDQAKSEADQIREQACQEAAAPATRERARILHQARMATLRISGEVRQEFIDTALERTRQRLACLYSESGYPAVLCRLTQQALDELACSSSDLHKATLQINLRDLDIIQRLLAEKDLDLLVQADLPIWGGLIVASEGAEVVVINTLEARLTCATPYLRRSLAALIENQECPVLTTAMPA